MSRIVKSQTDLQILGLYTRRPRKTPKNILKTLKELHNTQSFLPIVLTLENGSFSAVPDHISIFPAFYSVDRRATIPQAVAQSFCKHQASYMVAEADVRELSIYLIDRSDVSSISALAKELAVNFPQIIWLNLCFEHRYEIVSFLLSMTCNRT